MLLKRLKPYIFFYPVTKGKREWVVLHIEISERYFWVHKVEKLVFLIEPDVDFWAQGTREATLPHSSMAPGEVGHVPEGCSLPDPTYPFCVSISVMPLSWVQGLLLYSAREET